jgi:hypothetical protein
VFETASLDPAEGSAAADGKAPPQGRQDRAPRSRHGRRRGLDRSEWIVLAALAAASAVVAAAVSDASPTGTGWVDVVERGVVPAIMVFAAARARRWTVLGGAVILALGAEGPWKIVAVVGILAALALLATGRHRMLAGALGGLLGCTALHLRIGGPTGMETLLAAAALGLVLASAYRLLRSAMRRRWRLGLIIGLGVVVALGVASSIGVGMSVGAVEDAVAATRGAVISAQNGRGAEAARRFQTARRHFDEAKGSVDSWWVVGGRLIPVFGANLRAVQRTVHLGSDLTASAGPIASDVDFDRVQQPDGGVDLGLLTSFRAPVDETASVLSTAGRSLDDLHSAWIAPPLRDRLDDLRAQVGDLRSQTDAAALAIDRLPGLLGAHGPRRYLFLLGNSAEARDLGGHIGNWAEVVVQDGAIDLVHVGGPLELLVPFADAPKDLRGRFPASLVEMNPATFPQNWGAEPDLPTVARLSAELFRNKTGRQIDGVLYADATAFAAFLELTGPVDVPGLAQPLRLDSDNAADFLMHGQYVDFSDDASSSAALERVIYEVFDRLSSSELPGPKRLSSIFWPLVHHGHLQMATLHDEDDRLLERFGLRGAVPDPEGHDVLAVFNRNAGPNTIVDYLHWGVSVSTEWNPATGEVHSTVAVTLRNDAPASGLPSVILGNAAGYQSGTNITDLTIVTPFELRTVTVDGQISASRPQLQGELWRHTVRVPIRPSGGARIVFELSGSVRRGSLYRLDLLGQPLVNDSDVTVSLSTRRGDVVEKAEGSSGQGPEVLDGRADHVLEWAWRDA